MADTIFFVLIATYATVAMKVDQWQTIALLGFKLETPLRFLQHPNHYHSIRIFLFILCVVVASYFITSIAWYIGLAILASASLSAFWLGRKAAFNDYRRIHREMISAEESLKVTDPEAYTQLVAGEDPNIRRAELEAGSRISDQELLERLDKRLRWGI